MITEIEEILRQIEDWTSGHKKEIPVGEIRLFLSELREKQSIHHQRKEIK